MQLTFQKYEKGYTFIVLYNGIPHPYVITKVIPLEERGKAIGDYVRPFYRTYGTAPVCDRFKFNFQMTEDEMDSMEKCSDNFLQEYIDDYLAREAKNCLIDRS